MEEEEVQDGSLQSGVGAEDLIESLHMEWRPAVACTHTHMHTQATDRRSPVHTQHHMSCPIHTQVRMYMCMYLIENSSDLQLLRQAPAEGA